jgi:redox-sensitive bicupin YhaK (pirin superfamily)
LSSGLFPQANKMGKPFYQAAEKEKLPHVLQRSGVDFRPASGDYGEKTGPIENFTPDRFPDR